MAHQACFKDKSALHRSRPICVAAIDRAKETLICKRVTHLDQLANKLREARVGRAVEPLLAGSERHEFTSRDLEYVRDLGVIARHAPVRIANPIYREVVPRKLTYALQEALDLDPGRHRAEGGALDVTALMKRFQEFFRRHSEHWVRRFGYDEAGPQLILQAFLRRVVNSGGQIEREYGLGRRRTVFDMRTGKSWEERLVRRDPKPGGVPVIVWEMWPRWSRPVVALRCGGRLP